MAPKIKTAQKKTPKFAPNLEGLSKLLEEFEPLWEILKLVMAGPVGYTTEVNEIVEKQRSLVFYATKLADGLIDTFGVTLSHGVHLMKKIEDYIEWLVEPVRANEVFNNKIDELKKLSVDTWSAEENTILELLANFTKVNKTDDLEETVMAYNAIILYIDPLIAVAKAEAKRIEDEARREAEGREQIARQQRDRQKTKSILGRLSAA